MLISVCSVISVLELTIIIFLTQVSLRSVPGLSSLISLRSVLGLSELTLSRWSLKCFVL